MAMIVYSIDRHHDEIEEAVSRDIAASVKKLLSEKHLYQSVELGFQPVAIFAEAKIAQITEDWNNSSNLESFEPPTVEDFQESASLIAASLWLPSNVPLKVDVHNEGVPQHIVFAFPSINTYCSTCGDCWPCNPVDERLIRNSAAGREHLVVSYQCQQCQTSTITFLIAREGMKLRLAGRHPGEQIAPPKVLPKNFGKYYGDAIILRHAGQTLAGIYAGQTLAGIFLLRTFVEQFWRSHKACEALLQAQPRATGDEMGDAYQRALPEDFKRRFPSLKAVFSILSAAMHEANADAKLFDEAADKIVEHFDARRLFKIE